MDTDKNHTAAVASGAALPLEGGDLSVSIMWKPPRGPQGYDEHSAAEPQPKERGGVRRGPAAAAPAPRQRPLESAASLAANLLRLVLRAHSRAPGKILAAREDSEEL